MQRLVGEVALAVALFAVALYASAATREHGFEARLNSDEPEWIAISILHWRQLVLGEPPAGRELEHESQNPWKQGVQHTTFGYMNPCLPKLVWGAVLFARGHREASPSVFQVFQRDDPAAGARAREALLPALPAARGVIVALSALTAVLLFFCARTLAPGWPGWIAASAAFALWFASPLVQATSSYIRTDFFMLPCCLGALLLAVRARAALSGARGGRALVCTAVGLGVLSGLAVASKLNGALLCFAIALWIPLAWWRTPASSRASFARGPLLALAVAAACCVLLFWALNPVLWSEPLGGVRDVLARWDKLMRFFTEELGPAGGVEVPHSTWERLSLFARKTLARDEPLNALTGWPLGTLALGAGAVALVARALAREGETALAALVFCAVFLTGTALWLPLDWERFYLTALPCVLLLEAALVGSLASTIARTQRRLAASRT